MRHGSAGLLVLTSTCLSLLARAANNRTYAVPDEQLLYRDLMSLYFNTVRPVYNASRILIVKFGLRFNQIIDLDERLQIFTTNVFVDQEWYDESLTWNTSDYNGVTNMRMPAKELWLPDTFVYNNADNGTTGFMTGAYVKVESDGTVKWPVPVKLKSSCKVDISYFPFDDQTCELIFGSWIYSNQFIDYENMYEVMDLSCYVDNSEWELLSISVRKELKPHTARDEKYNHLVYELKIRRKTFYYIFNIIIPCTSLSVLTLLTFWLPAAAAEKITLGLSVFLAFSMFMLLIAEQVPATSNTVPLIGVYLATVMTMTSMSVVMAVMVINLFNRGAKVRRAPRWLCKVMFNGVARLLLINTDALKESFRLLKEEEGRLISTLFDDNAIGYRKNRRAKKQRERAKYVDRRLSTIGCIEGLEVLQRRVSSTSSRGSYASFLYPDTKVSRRYSNARSISSGEASQRNSYTEFDLPVFNIAPSSAHEDGPTLAEEIECAEKGRRDLARSCSTKSNQFLDVYNSPYTSYRRGSSMEDIWIKREDAERKSIPKKEEKRRSTFLNVPANDSLNSAFETPTLNRELVNSRYSTKLQALQGRKEMIVEWQTIAVIIDRALFWLFCAASVAAYIWILVVEPSLKAKIERNLPPSFNLSLVC